MLSQLVESLGDRPIRGAEVGTLRGNTSRHLLDKHPALFLLMIDTWERPAPSSAYAASGDSAARQSASQQFANMSMAYQQTAFAEDRRDILRCSADEAVGLVPEQSLDFAFIDADHTFDQVRNDIQNWWPKIRNGGILSGHDYNSPKDRSGHWGVKKAVDEFAAHMQLDVVEHGCNVWSIQKNMTPARLREDDRSPEPVVVRLLSGLPPDSPVAVEKIKTALTSEWSRSDALHVVANAEYRPLLDASGVQHVIDLTERLQDERPNCLARDIRPWLIRRVLDSHRELLCVDIGCRVRQQPDADMWNRLRSKGGRFDGDFQATGVSYRRRSRVRVLPENRTQRVRMCLGLSVLYCSDSVWIDNWLDSSRALNEMSMNVGDDDDESSLLYSIECRSGLLTPESIARDFELSIHSSRRRGIIPKDKTAVYFSS